VGLPWVRLDTQFASNPKVLQLTSTGKWRAAFVYVASLGYCGAHGTDGYIPETAMNFLHSTRQNAIELVKAGLWHEDVGGYCINGWEDCQVVDEAAKKRSDKARKAAMSRWHGDEDV
jgi:hypothetical protein